MVSILSNGVDFLSIARGSFRNNGIGLSPSARALNQKFMEQGRVLFNSLYADSENQEVNNQKQILGLRAKMGISTDEVAESTLRARQAEADEAAEFEARKASFMDEPDLSESNTNVFSSSSLGANVNQDA